MYNSQFQLFGSTAYLLGETHIDPKESTVTYELCQQIQPDLICVESPNDELYPSKSTGHDGLQSYVDETETPVVGIDTKPSKKSAGKVSEQIGDIFNNKKDEQSDEIQNHRSRRMDDPITDIEEREEDMVQNTIDAIHYYNPDKVFILVGKMHAEAITNTLSFIGSI